MPEDAAPIVFGRASVTYATYPSLKDRAVILTGGASGIGAQTVRRLAEQGTKVGFLDLAVEAGRALVDELSDAPHTPIFAECDLRDIAALREAMGTVLDAIGTPYALVNNAAHDDRHDWREVEPDYWDERFHTNLRHQFFAIQAVAPRMFEAGVGSIVNVGSTSWQLKKSQMIAYTTAKSAVHGLTRSFTQEFGQHGVRLNTVMPGWVMTERQKELWYGAEGGAEIAKFQALKDEIQPDDLANMILFLCADDSRMCTGQEFYVEGGWL